MKSLLFLLLFLPFAASAQTEKDYQDVMDKFVRYYNADLTDSICTLFPERTERPGMECFWRWAQQDGSSLKKYGKIKSYQYLGKVTQDPEKVAVFKVVYAKKGTKALSFNLPENHKFGTFRFDTTDDEIAAMLKKAR